MEKVSLLPNEEAVVNICKMFIGNVVGNVQEKRDEDGFVEWGKGDAFALIVGVLDSFKSLSAEKQNELIEYFEGFAK